MSELSPAAQAVLAAAINDTADIINKPHCDWIHGYSRQIAAALRAAVEQLGFQDDYGTRLINVEDLFVITNELENGNE